jgi:hypothetical protein
MTTIARLDTLTPIHKGLRRALFETAIQLARTDFGTPDAIAAARQKVAQTFDFLREHAAHEDREVVPIVARLDPALAEQLHLDHPELERLAIAVESLWPRIEALDVALARDQLGAELARRFNAVVAAQLAHMDREERDLNAVLWAHLRDDELAQLGRRIVSVIPPARMQEWGALIDPSLNDTERRIAAAQRAAA